MSDAPGVGSMKEDEVVNFIKNNRVGVLTLVDGNRPYGVPVEHYYDGKSLYFIVSTREGQRKINCIKNNANACFTIYESRREKPELVSDGIPCRSVIIEGSVSSLGVKEVASNSGTFSVQMLKLDVDKIGNWNCPRSSTCDWQTAWFERFPDSLQGTN